MTSTAPVATINSGTKPVNPEYEESPNFARTSRVSDREPERAAADVAEEDGLLFACRLDGRGGAALLDWAAVEAAEGDAPIWVHLSRESPRSRRWLQGLIALPRGVVDTLLAEETRPRVLPVPGGTVAILRGVNLHPEAEPNDLVTLRLWTDGRRLISLRQRRLLSPRDVLDRLLGDQRGARDAAELFEQLLHRLTERMGATVLAFDERLDEVESGFVLERASVTRRELTELRQQVVALRRYLSPQREALTGLLLEPPDWLSERSRYALRETDDRLLRYVEELDAARERAVVIKDDIANQLSEAANRTLYLLSIVSAIFLPLGFVTGLLGINVGGMPGVDSPWAFWIACAVMALIALAELALFRKWRWLGG